jgi:hypothetical protein
MNEQDSARIRELERRVDFLTTVVAVLTIYTLYQIVPSILILLLFGFPALLIGFLLLLPILAFTHQYLPAFSKKCGRAVKFVMKTITTSRNSSKPSVG